MMIRKISILADVASASQIDTELSVIGGGSTLAPSFFAYSRVRLNISLFDLSQPLTDGKPERFIIPDDSGLQFSIAEDFSSQTPPLVRVNVPYSEAGSDDDYYSISDGDVIITFMADTSAIRAFIDAQSEAKIFMQLSMATAEHPARSILLQSSCELKGDIDPPGTPPPGGIDNEYLTAEEVRGLIGGKTEKKYVDDLINTRAMKDHTHTPASIGAAAASHTHVAADITDLSVPADLSELTDTTGVIAGRAPVSHTHAAAELNGVVKSINGAAPDASGNATVTTGTGGLDQTAVDARIGTLAAPLNHGHPPASIGAAAGEHRHDASEIDNLPPGGPGSGLDQTAVDARIGTLAALKTHVHVAADITDLSVPDDLSELTDTTGVITGLDERLTTLEQSAPDPSGGMTEAERARLLPTNPVNGDIAIYSEVVTGVNYNDDDTIYYLNAANGSTQNLAKFTNSIGFLPTVNFPAIVNGAWPVNGADHSVAIVDSEYLTGEKDFTFDFYLKTSGFAETSRRDMLLVTDSPGAQVHLSNYNVGAAGKYDIWVYNEHALAANIDNGNDVHIAIDVWMDAGTRRWASYVNGAMVHIGTGRFSDVTGLFGNDGYGNTFSGEVKYFRISKVARYKGAAFAPPGPAGYPLPSGGWIKRNLAELVAEIIAATV